MTGGSKVTWSIPEAAVTTVLLGECTGSDVVLGDEGEVEGGLDVADVDVVLRRVGVDFVAGMVLRLLEVVVIEHSRLMIIIILR